MWAPDEVTTVKCERGGSTGVEPRMASAPQGPRWSSEELQAKQSVGADQATVSRSESDRSYESEEYVRLFSLDSGSETSSEPDCSDQGDLSSSSGSLSQPDRKGGDSTSSVTCKEDDTSSSSQVAEQTSEEQLLVGPHKLLHRRRRLASDSLESLAHSEVVRPAIWTERQAELATLGLQGMKGASWSEVLWYGHVRIRSLVCLTLLYASQYSILVALGLPLMLLERQQVALVCLAYLIGYCFFVLFSNAEFDGSRAWLPFQRWFGSMMEEASVLHFNGGIRLIRDFDKPLSPSDKYIFGYHPHGLMPAILAWFPMTDAWRKLFPAVRPIGLVATAIFKVPVMRDLNLWGGLRNVSRKSFARALDQMKAVVICPGGQAELSLHKHSAKKTIVLSARKQGFVRLAIQQGARLVPMVVFGEAQLLDNPFHLPSAQRFTYKLIGFPIPFCPVGLGGCLPIPRKGRVTLVVGEPFDPRDVCPSAEVTPQGLEAARKLYYERVMALVEKYQGHEHVGHDSWKYIVDTKR